MQELANVLINNGAQCWACPIFDNLFAIISTTAAAVYKQLTLFSIIIFGVLFGFYISNIVWQNIKSGVSDPFYKKTFQPILIKSLLVLTILACGLVVPRFISNITFEPVASITLAYTKAMLPENQAISDNYTKIALNEDSFFTPKLRDTILQLLQTSVSNFQVYIKIGVAIIDSTFSLPSRLDVGLFIKRLLVFFTGLYLTYNFAKLFIMYSFCFMDIIVAMLMFAFFFPLSLVLFIFKGDSSLPDWFKNLGNNLGAGQIKTLINAIVSVASAILTYTVIMLLIRGYLNGNNINTDSIQNAAESIFDFNLDNPNAIQVTFFGSIVLVYVVNYLATQIPNITNEIMATFNIQQKSDASEAMGKDMWALTNTVASQAKQLIKNVVNPDEKLNEGKSGKTDTNK